MLVVHRLSSRSPTDQRIISSADLLRRGATLLSEACPRCGGVQVKYNGHVYCLNEDDLSELLSGEKPKTEKKPQQQATPEASKKTPEELSEKKLERRQSSGSDQLRATLEEKLKKLAKQLEDSDDVDEQTKLLELIQKYVDTLNKL